MSTTNVGINVAVTSTGTQQVTVQLNNIGAAAQKSAQQVDSLNRLLAGIGVGAALAQLKQYLDTWNSFEGAVRVSTNSMAQAAAVQDQLFQIAQRTRQPLQDVGTAYQRIAIQADALGLSQNQLLKITETLGDALVVQHTTVNQAAGALLQYTQALGTGKVRAQEWNSILTGLPVLAKAIAEQMGKPVAAIKNLLATGGLTSQQLAQYTLQAQAGLQAQLAKSASTISQGFTVLKNAAIQWVGETADALNANQTLAQSFAFLATHFDTIAKTALAAAAGFAAWYAVTSGLPALITGVTGAVRGLTAALLANPITALAAVITAATAALVLFRNEILVDAQAGITLGDYMTAGWQMVVSAATTAWTAIKPIYDFLRDGLNGVWESLTGSSSGFFDSLGSMLKSFVNIAIGSFVGWYNVAVDVWTNFPQVFIQLVVQAVNGAAESMLGFFNQSIEWLNKLGDKLNFHIDPVDFTPLTAGAKQAAIDIDADFKAANKDYVGDLTKQLAAGAAAAAAARKAAANVGDPQLDAHGAAVPIPDKASKALEKLQNQLRSLLNTIDPAAGALLDMARDDGILKKALDAHLITGAQYVQYLAAVKAHYVDIIDPIGAVTRLLDQQTQVLQFDGDAQKAASVILDNHNKLVKQGKDLTSQQTAEIIRATYANEEANRVAQQRTQILNTYAKPQQDYLDSLTAANQLYANGKISANEYSLAIDNINKSYLDTQRTFSAGAGSAILDFWNTATNEANIAKDGFTSVFDDMTTAIENFATTGKFSFSSLVTSILTDLLKMETKILESKILTGLFGSGSGLLSALGLGGGEASSLGLSGASAANLNAGASAINLTPIPGIGLAGGGYTGDGDPSKAAGFVHGQEYVLNSEATRAIGKSKLDQWNNGGYTPEYAMSSSSQAGPAQVNMTTIIQNNASDKVSVTQQQGTDANGNQQMKFMIDSIEKQIAGNITKGQGPVHGAIRSKFNVKSKPGV